MENQDLLKVLKYVRKFEEIDKAQSERLSAEKSFMMAKVIAKQSVSSDRNEQIMGYFHEISLRNAALWQLIALIGLRKDRPHPRRVLLQRFIRLLSLVLIIDIERAMAESGTKGMIWRIRNSSSPLKEFGGEAINDLLGVCKLLDQIEIYRQIERPLESILLVKNIRVQSRANV